MKTSNIVLTIVFAILMLDAAAQSNIAQRPVSKDIQKIANKNALSEEQLLTVASKGYPIWTISKGVQVLNTDTVVPYITGNIPSKGYPFWTISKGVYRKVTPVKEKLLKPLKDVIATL